MDKEALMMKRNELAKNVGEALKRGEDASHIIAEMAEISDKLKGIEEN